MPPKLKARFIGVELYFDHLDEGKRFYGETLGFDIRDEVPGHFTRFVTELAFICLECKGMESYPSRDKAVIFLEVPNLVEAVNAVVRPRMRRASALVQRPSAPALDFWPNLLQIAEFRTPA
jgi:hypothetical protein